MFSEEEVQFHVQDNLNYVKIHKNTLSLPPSPRCKQWLFLDGRTMNDRVFFSSLCFSVFVCLLCVLGEEVWSLPNFSYFLPHSMDLYNFPLIFFDACFENNHYPQKEGISLE